jgi:hypothetical protein
MCQLEQKGPGRNKMMHLYFVSTVVNCEVMSAENCETLRNKMMAGSLVFEQAPFDYCLVHFEVQFFHCEPSC